MHTPASTSAPHARDRDATWRLIRDDVFDRIRSEEDLDALVVRFTARSATPYSDVVRRLLGMEELSEEEAHAFYKRLVDHWRRLSRSVGRAVHPRVAALDLVTLRPARVGSPSATRPIVVTPSLIEKALEEAASDAVTGLPQRAHFMGVVRHELRQRKRRGIAVVYIDLDRFKQVNDTHGHARGDDVLRALARAGRVALRHGDLLARVGGDEFAILLLDVTPEEAEAAVRRLRDRFEARTATLGVSFSAGIAISLPGESAEDLLARADAEMYRDKRERGGVR
ncbi:MAG TPA: GGDEF domain-containing protein [Labilithrix sp.]|jgi:diguanylate cyclase (GGDEF)-like protein